MNHYNPHQTHHVPSVCSDSDSCSEEDKNFNIPSSTHNPTRKRRRGIIEKRRRDRINTSLSELKRLVPQALEKSGSAKLEKAEILQMTVEHLKNFKLVAITLLLFHKPWQSVLEISYYKSYSERKFLFDELFYSTAKVNTASI